MALVLVALMFPLAVPAAEMGRREAVEIPTARDYTKFWADPYPALEAGGDFLFVDWKVGSQSLDDNALAPVLALMYRATKWLDLRAAMSFYSVKDRVEESLYDLDVFQFGLGARYWLLADSEFSPVAGVSLQYLHLDSDTVDGLDGTLAASGEAGLVYQGIDKVQVYVGLTFGKTLKDSEGDYDGGKQDVSLDQVGVGFRVHFLF